MKSCSIINEYWVDLSFMYFSLFINWRMQHRHICATPSFAEPTLEIWLYTATLSQSSSFFSNLHKHLNSHINQGCNYSCHAGCLFLQKNILILDQSAGIFSISHITLNIFSRYSFQTMGRAL